MFASRIEALRGGLRDLGYEEGKNLLIEFAWADTVDQLPGLAARFVRMNVDVIFAPVSTFVEPARRATNTIPIVFASHADPVGLGHVQSLSHPGGNITGLSMLLTPLAAKGLEMLHEVIPHSLEIGVLWNPTTPSHGLALEAVKHAGEQLGVQVHPVPTRTERDFDEAFDALTKEHVSGVLVLASPLAQSDRRMAQLALEHRLPSMFTLRENAETGGLMSYSADILDLWRRSAVYVDKILKGAKPADLPVEQASKYDLAINLKTAKALGLDFPATIYARATEIIE
jgi:putative ABC transport system substrate-binding protein